MRPRLAGLIMALVVALQSLQVAQAAGRQPPEPTVPSGGGVTASSAGDWYVGATPPNVDYTKPVLVFVHGRASSASVWWGATAYHGTNDMYAYAYDNGYRTAFVDVYPDATMWANGQLLNQQLDQIRSYFGVDQVAIVGHSKGGLDANAASAHYGAASKISRVITLGAPHWGSPLADLAYSTWTWWLAELLGVRDDATYVLQTGYMDYFRSVTDGLDPSVPYYTVSGNKCGPLFTALWFSCMAISGQDDGLVPVWSAQKPGAVHLQEGSWDHDEIKMGSRTWSVFAPMIATAGAPHAAEGPRLAALPAPATRLGRGLGAGPRPETPGNLILRGSVVDQAGQSTTLPIESGVNRVSFMLYASDASLDGTLVGPDGQTYPIKPGKRVPTGEPFAGAWLATADLKNPASGEWSLRLNAPEQTGYLLVTALDSNLKATLNAGSGIASPGEIRKLRIGFAPGRVITSTRSEGAIGLGGKHPQNRSLFSATADALQATISLPTQTGIHNITISVTGITGDGTAFERTLVTSVAAVPLAERGKWLAPITR